MVPLARSSHVRHGMKEVEVEMADTESEKKRASLSQKSRLRKLSEIRSTESHLIDAGPFVLTFQHMLNRHLKRRLFGTHKASTLTARLLGLALVAAVTVFVISHGQKTLTHLLRTLPPAF